MPQKPHRNGHRWPVPACAGLCLALAAGGLQAMNPPGSPGSCSSSSVQAPPMIPLFSLTSHLAASDAAKAFIRSRLAGWELEQASLRVLAETTCDHFCGQLTLNRIDLDQIYRRLNPRTASREEIISNPEYELIVNFEKAPFMAEFQGCLPDLDRTLEEDVKQLRSRIAEVCGASCDAIYCGGFSEWEGDPKGGSGPLITSLLAAIQQQGFAGSAPSKLLQYMKSLDETVEHLTQLDEFMFEWLKAKRRQLVADVQRLEANLRTPGLLAESEAEVAVEVEAAELEAGATFVESKLPLEPERETPERKEPSKQTVPSLGPGKAASRFDAYYRFVDCSRRAQAGTAAFRVGKGVARIRAEVEAQSMDLTSAKVIRLAEALAPYGARCEAHRKKGIMIKLPALDPELGFVAKFIHRSHPSHDSIDVNTREALKTLFDASIFAADKF